MISVDACRDKRVTSGLGAEKIREMLDTAGNTLWVDMQAPTEEDWEMLTEEFKFHSLAIEDARKQFQRPKADAYPGYLFLTTRYWTGVETATADLHDVTLEIDIFLGPNYLVTIHDE